MLFHALECGPQILVSEAEYLGGWVSTGEHHDLDISPPIDHHYWGRSDRNSKKAMTRLDARLEKFHGIHRSMPDKHILWEVLMFTLFGYVSQHYLISPGVIKGITKHLVRFLGVSWWMPLGTYR